MKYLIFILIVFYQIAFASTPQLQGQFEIPGVSKKIKEGEIVEAVLRIWPVEKLDSGMFDKLLDTDLFGALHLLQLKSVEASPNNAEVVELKGIYIVKHSSALEALKFEHNNQLVTISPPDIIVEKNNIPGEDYLFLDQGGGLAANNKIVYALVFLIMALLIAWYLKKYYFNKKPNQTVILIKKFDELFKNTKTREELEQVYLTRDEWMGLMPEVSPAHKNFFDTLNLHQFKKDWDDEELKIVMESFETIRGSFKK